MYKGEVMFICPLCGRLAKSIELSFNVHTLCTCGKGLMCKYEKFIIDRNDYIEKPDTNEVKNMDMNINKITVGVDPATPDPETMFTVIKHRPEHTWVKKTKENEVKTMNDNKIVYECPECLNRVDPEVYRTKLIGDICDGCDAVYYRNYEQVVISNDPDIPDDEKFSEVVTARSKRPFTEPIDDADRSTDTALKIMEATESLAAMLTDKNKKYGDAALRPAKVFSKLYVTNSLLIRADDKLNRIINNPELRRDDLTDLAGYLVLIMIANGWEGYEPGTDMYTEVV